MKTTVHNVKSRHGIVKLVLFIEGSEQKCHVFKGDQLVNQYSYSKDQDIDIDLLDLLKSDIAHL